MSQPIQEDTLTEMASAMREASHYLHCLTTYDDAEPVSRDAVTNLLEAMTFYIGVLEDKSDAP